MKSMIPVLMLVATPVAAKAADPSLLDEAPVTMTRKLADQCTRLERRGGVAPWFCGRKEGPLAPPLADACPDRAWVGYRLDPASQCPSAPSPLGTWTVAAPFGRSQDARLQRLCTYTWEPASTARPAPDVAALPDVRGLRLERDCEVVGGHAVPQAVADELFDAWGAQVELPDWSAAVPFGAPRIRVAVIDGGVPGEGPLGAGADTVAHPAMVSSVIRSIGCPDRGTSALCPVATPSYNAMPYVLEGTIGELGGYFGSQGSFAAAMADAVDSWLTESPITRPAHLILNLSLGWDADFDITQVERVPGAAALWATQAATCAGALVVAAAGNQAGPSDAGPLFPAAWEAFPRACGAQPGVYSPLVHAVGAVDGRDFPLGISRPGANPRLSAAGSVVVVPRDTGAGLDVPTSVLSGTSIAAAAASGAAGLIWSLRPSLSPDQVMALLYGTAESLGELADFGLGAAPADRRRLSIARAFEAACPEGVAIEACPAPASRPAMSAPRAAFVPSLPDFAAIEAIWLQNPVDIFEDQGAIPPPAPSAYYSPYVVPQPGEPNCPICGFTGYTLNGKLSDALFGATLGQPVVQIVDSFGNPSQVYLDPIAVGQTFKIDLAYKLQGMTLKSAWLEIPAIQNNKNVLTSSELYVH
ncbi:MAG: S8 family serine peptidase [bacterium]